MKILQISSAMQFLGAIICKIDKRNRDKCDSHVLYLRPEARTRFFKFIIQGLLYYRTMEISRACAGNTQRRN